MILAASTLPATAADLPHRQWFLHWLNPAFPHPHILWTLAGIAALLLLGTLISFALLWQSPGKLADEIWARTRTWWILVLAFVLALALCRTLSLVLLAFLSFLALKEYLSLIPTRRADRRVLFWAYLAIPIQYFWLSFDPPWYGMFIIFVPVFVFLFLPMRMVLIGETQGFLRAVGSIHWGMMITVYSLGHLAALLCITISEKGSAMAPPHLGNPNAGGVGLLLYLAFLTQFNDIAQFCWGKPFGRHKILPTVSPNKTTVGFIGGVLTTIALAWLLGPYLTPFTPLEAATAGLLIGLAGFLGDVTIAALKRDLGIKDTGALLPGHGGILDRVNSLSYTAPLFFHYVRYLYY